jgi:hypothetical protein
MADLRVNGVTQPPDQTSTDQIAQIKNLVANLDEEDKQATAAELVKDILDDEAKMVVAAGAMKTASGEAQQELVTQAVRSADTVEAKQAAAAEAVKTAHDGEKNRVVAQVVRSADTVEAKQAAAAEAVNSASVENKVKVAIEGVDQLSPTQQKELVDRLPITPDTADEIWRTVVGAFKWVLWGSTLALVAAIGVALFRDVDQALVQILLTVFTTVVGIFAGFIGGKALGGSTGE